MRVSKHIKLLSALTIMAASLGAASAQVSNAAQATPAAASAARPELALDFSYLRSNAPPGGCTCFNLYGGSAAFAWPIAKGPYALAADITVAQNGSISSHGFGLTLSTYTVGLRYEPKLRTPLLHPFGQALAGIAHASGSLVQGPGTSVGNAGAAFAANVGGGVDLAASRRLWVRAFQIEYLPTSFDNGAYSHQNNLRLSAGVVVRF
jgi:peptidoglycan-associated lipoprotein